MYKKLTVTELNRQSPKEVLQKEKNPVIILLDNVRSMHNVGSFFRTCDAFNIEKIVLTGLTAQPPHREIQKTALGATESVAWEYKEDTLLACHDLLNKGYTLIAIEQVENSAYLNAVNWKLFGKKNVFIFGHEIYGVQQEVLNICNLAIEIPQFGAKHSLNVSVVAGVVLYERCIRSLHEFA